MSQRAQLSGRAAALLTAVAICGVLGPSADAAVVEPMTVATLADYAGQVIAGDVESVRSYWADNPRRIESEVVFRNVEYLKGRPANSEPTFRLVVPGGTVGDTTLRLADAPAFAAGQRWLLFLLPVYKTFPVVGISQGAFRVQTDAAGVPRVYETGGRPVTGLDADGFIQVVPGAGRDAASQLVGAANVRLSAARAQAGAATALAYDEFTALLRPILEASRDHRLTAPAGRRAAVAYEVMPLQPAGGQWGVEHADAGSERAAAARQAVQRRTEQRSGTQRQEAQPDTPADAGRAEP